jgi:hypothetical protein
LINACQNITPARESLTNAQKFGLDMVARLSGGRDVVLAIDLTESVGLNDEGRIRLRQIVQDSLSPGDSVYVVPFATTVNPLMPNINPLTAEKAIKFHGQQDIDKILQVIPLRADRKLQNTDIQRAELFIYQNLAQLNQCRLGKIQPIKPQSIVWMTDAPLLTKPGITTDIWVETPLDSPLRLANSPESLARKNWLEKLPIKTREQPIKTNNNKEYKLTVIDIAPTVQEFCTPAPGGKESCLVNRYLFKQLWLPVSISAIFLIALVINTFKFYRGQKKWQLILDFLDTEKEDDKICSLGNNQRIAIGEYDPNCVDSIDTLGPEIRAYLVRKGEKLYIEPTGDATIFLNRKEITEKTLISSSLINLNCPDPKRKIDFEITIKIKK